MAAKKPTESESTEPTSLVTEMSDAEKTEEKKFNEFMEIQRVIGNVRVQFPDLTPLEQTTFKESFKQWVAAGEPKPSFQNLPKVVLSVPVDIFRIKSKGKEWIHWDTTDGKHPGIIVGANQKITGHDVEYSIEKLQSLFKERDELLSPDQNRNCYMELNSKRYVIHQEDMLKPYDDVATKLKEGTYFF